MMAHFVGLDESLKLLFHEVFFEIKISTSGKQFCHFDPHKSIKVGVFCSYERFIRSV